MSRKKRKFRLTKKGKIFFAISVIVTLSLPAFIYRFQICNLIGITKASNSISTTTNDNISNLSRDRIEFRDESITNSIVPHKNPYIIVKSNIKAKEEKAPAVDEEFFSRALFIGDSITEGIKDYGILDNSNVFAVKGLTISKAEKEIDKIVNRKPDKIYILLGSNDLLYGMDSDKFSSRYVEFIEKINDKLPDTKVYIQSIFPVSRDVEVNRPMLSNSRIDEFNAKLRITAKEKGIGFIDVSDLLKDGNGIMNSEYTSDGIHVKYKFYNIWLDCVKKSSTNS